MAKKSRHRLKGEIIKIARGVAIYQTHASPFYFARLLDPGTKKYIVRSTKETSRVKARQAAEELAEDIRRNNPPVPEKFSFRHYAQRMIVRGETLVASGERNKNYIRTTKHFVNKDDWGLIRHFGNRDVRELKTRDYNLFMERITEARPNLTGSTKNTIMATFRNVLKVALDDGVIEVLPSTPRPKQKDNPRPYFKFTPLVARDRDEYDRLKKGAKALAAEKAKVRGVPVTQELYDLILFCIHSFVRPMTTELFALKHSHVTVVPTEKQPHLLLTIRGKTGLRQSGTMPAAVAVYQRIQKRYPKASHDDYLFLPQYRNRETACRIMQRQFNHLLDVTKLKHDPDTTTPRTMYSLRHTAICMRLVNSKGKVNVYTLAKNAGTSVDQIERFYAKRLPISNELMENLHSFGE
jgi:hypothetical protein